MTFGIRAVFEAAGFAEVLECHDFRKVSMNIEKFDPDVILFDLHMPGMNLDRDFFHLKRKHADQIFIAYTADFDPGMINNCRKLGFRGYLLKGESIETMQKKILSILDGSTIFPETTPETPRTASMLTEMQVQVLKLMAADYKNGDIAKALKISEATVDYHKRNIKNILAANTSVEAVILAKQHGWI